MKKATFLVAACMVAGATVGTVKAQTPDSLKVEHLHEAVVTATQAPKNAPFAISRVSNSDIQSFSQDVQELPFLFAHTPGVMAWGDNGLGTGTSYLRIRGAADSRINVTLDGVPMNSPEDQCVFWANMNSYSSFLGGVEIQRGVGSSSNGDGAFGGTVAMTTKKPSMTPEAQFDLSYGTYNSLKAGASFSTGLMGGKWGIDGGFHQTSTDGYIHGTAGHSGSWIGSVTFIPSDKVMIRYRNVGNYEHTGQAWNGVSTEDLLDGTYGAKTGIFGYADMVNAGLGRYNNLCEYWTNEADGSYSFTAYPQVTTDNFLQDHNILSASWQIDDKWTASAALHYTYGEGYYSEFRSNNKLSKFGLAKFVDKNSNTVEKSDFVRKKGLTQNTYGVVMNAARTTDAFDLRLGASAQNFSGNHYGYLTYVGNEELRAKICPDGSYYKYYDSDADKLDASAFAKATWKIGAGFSLFGDLQYRYVRYMTDGVNDKFRKNSDGTYSNQVLDINETYNFFNPKGGVEFHRGAHGAFVSVAVSHREPERNNFTDNGSSAAPVPERLIDYELGYNYGGKRLQASVTLYYMDYHNQFVQTGMVSDIGEALTTNIEKSYRTGVELSGDLKVCKWLDIDADAALSVNRLLDFDEDVEDWDSATGYRSIHYDSTPIAFSPACILGGGFNAHYKGAKMVWHTAYVSRQYLDNTGCDSRSIPGYSTTDIDLSYTIAPELRWMREVSMGFRFGNIFDSHHACKAWVYSAIAESCGHYNDNRYTQIGYFPVAGATALFYVTLKF